ncbi:conserved hypothetical protein [Talaromyces stipitatus ATCC 10500]|uniref:BZIP transcription factor n=1 Tax=Talaromyces stipitatus (strain ATCC 10500 / CBS 375.48 / QM 6759 / NRRL 1006) TaxID=441959 RepID=B8MPD9_TALSN|nr:uncharacterized protein TSTA_105890 [Talaromyces stipitatus ATCC 10500]EED14378.1 conserved hypothetical protein [Talaromyces stipitatus ATCC 10500]
MSSTCNTNVLSSSEKKRLRDRRAQQTLREKRQNRMLELEARVAFCERNHGAVTKQEVLDQSGVQDPDVQKLLDTVESLRRENNRLRERQESLRQMVGTWDLSEEHDQKQWNDEKKRAFRSSSGVFSNGGGQAFSESNYEASSSPGAENHYQNITATAATMNRIDPKLEAHSGIPATLPISALTSFANTISLPHNFSPTPHPVVHLPSPPAISSSVPVWCRVPRNSYDTNNTNVVPLISARWFSHPELVTSCPLQPSPLDLLYGTRRNYLANNIHDLVRQRALRDAETVAIGYLIYNYSKWRASPTPATFARLVPFQHPTPLQLEQDHFGGIDMMIWPKMRENMIRRWHELDFVEVFDFLSCCMKVRWPWNKDMLERDAEDNLQIREDFRQIFSREDGWGLTAEFIDRYPMLLEGMDLEALRFEIAFPTEIMRMFMADIKLHAM